MHPGEKEVTTELTAILDWWRTYSPDSMKPGFYGEVGNNNRPTPGAEKGGVYHSRILWTFSAAYAFTSHGADLALAARAFEFIRTCLTDAVHGGLFWSVTDLGLPKSTHKQIYAQAFGIYGLTEYHMASGNNEALAMAIALYDLIERFGFDGQHNGYIEALEENWTSRQDQRLSGKEINVPKTMNTHLHVLEAYANLYRVWQSDVLREKIENLLYLFLHHVIDGTTYHLRLYFDAAWRPLIGPVSFGHDIEAGWLLLESAKVTGNDTLIKEMERVSLLLTNAALRGLDSDGGLWYEFDPGRQEMIREKHWWPQAECQVALLNAWQISKDPRYLDLMKSNWLFIGEKIRDKAHGEWIWGVDDKGEMLRGQPKAGLWKGPYHNSRCCFELLKRLNGNTGIQVDHSHGV